MEKVGKVEFFNLPDKSYKWDEYAEGVLRDLLAKAGLKARADVMRLMIERAGPYPRQLHQEVEKLSLYVRDRKEITREDVLDIVSPARENSYGELADAFAKQDLPGALRVTRRLLQQKEQPVGLMMGLQTRVHDLLVYRTCLARRWARLTGSDDWPKVEWSSGPEAEEYLSSLANDPRRANPYWAGILAKQAQRFELDHLHDVQRQLVEIHGRITDGSAPADFMLEWFLITALGTNRHAA
jgi:DNA polymerase III delta subunit